MDDSPPNNAPTGKLFVVATPIGNLEDITLRAIRVLGQVDIIAAEDTRHTRKLLGAHDIEGQLISYHEHNERQRTQALTKRMAEGETVALVSDAGTPSVSDPGYRLVQAATAKQIPVVPIPGVSAVVTALSASGLETDSFTFIGFPSRKKSKRLDQLKALADAPQTLIFYQSPRRVVGFLEEICQTMGDRTAVAARELTKLHEEFIRGNISDILADLKGRASIKGEFTLLVAGHQSPPPSEADLDEAVRQALASKEKCKLGDIAKTLSRQLKVTRKTIYDKALELKNKNEPPPSRQD